MYSHSPATAGGRRWTVTKGAAAAAVLAITLVGCGTDVELGGQHVDDKVPFLGQIEDQWRNDIAKATVATGDGTHCWLPRQKDGKEFDRKAFCGPVKHLGAGQAGVWDVYSFDATVADDNVTVNNIGLTDIGADFPADRTAYRADGAKIPKDAGQLAAPKPPPADKGFAVKVSPEHSPKVLDSARPKNGKIIAPGIEVAVSEAGRLDQLDGYGDEGIVGPAEGEELRAITFTVKQDEDNSQWGDSDITPVFSVVTPAGKKVLDLTEDKGFGSKQLPTDAITVVASVPAGQDAQFTVGVAGLDQTISMKTGDRTSKTAAGFYKATTNVGLGKQYPTQTLTVGDFTATHGVTFASADVIPYVAGRGWAKEGKTWLRLNYTNATFDRPGVRDWWFADPTFQVGKSLVLTDDAGRPLTFTGTLPVSLDKYSDGTGQIIAEIPETAKSVKVVYGPAGTFAATASAPTGAEGPTMRSGSFQFKPMTFTVAIPQG